MATTANGGRPRDPEIDERVLAATRTLLVEFGWDGTSVRGVADLAGVSRPAIVRRWPTKAHLVLEALIGPEPDMVPFEGVDLDGWIEGVIEGAFDLFGRPEMRTAVPALLGVLGSHDDLRAAVWAGFTGPAADLASEIAGRDRHRVAQAAIVAAAGAALFSVAVVDDADVRESVRRLLRQAFADALGPAPG